MGISIARPAGTEVSSFNSENFMSKGRGDKEERPVRGRGMEGVRLRSKGEEFTTWSKCFIESKIRRVIRFKGIRRGSKGRSRSE